MNYARIRRSPRLQRVYRVLLGARGGREVSSMDILHQAELVSLTASISELRANGAVIPRPRCEDGVHYYTLAAEIPCYTLPDDAGWPSWVRRERGLDKRAGVE